MHVRVWQAVDSMAHFLYRPTTLGRRSNASRWHHNLHLIPGRVLGFVCDRFDLALGLSEAELRRAKA